MSAGDRDPLGDGVPSRAGGRAGLGGRIRSTRREIIIHQGGGRERGEYAYVCRSGAQFGRYKRSLPLRRWQTKPEWLSGISLFRPAKGQI